jgi:hypothetical protein
MDQAVKSRFDQYPKEAKMRLVALRNLNLTVATS